jgi:hypothetical protein
MKIFEQEITFQSSSFKSVQRCRVKCSILDGEENEEEMVELESWQEVIEKFTVNRKSH